jgi:DNA repair exonuclease SbcCD nuclease subunit
MKLAIITDTHYGCRKGSKLFHDYFELFYKNVFFPKLEEHGVEAVIHMGDVFDSRKSIDYQSLEWSKRVVFDPLSKYEVHMVVGNHDAYYKNTNNTNSPELLLDDYKNIKKYSSPKEIKVGNLDILLIPWICQEDQDKVVKIIKKTKCKIAMGHLELQGFVVHRGFVMDHGMEFNIFDKFSKVFSGHYHTRSNNGKIFYLGNPYEIYWNDVNDTRGFHIFDTETLEHFSIDNPYKMFKVIHYEDTPYQMFDTREYENKIAKLIVRKKSDTKQFEKFVDKLYAANVAELKIVENFQIQESENFEVFESEDTLSILNRYIEDAEINLDKTFISQLMSEVYQEACELV